jgi:polyhydroxyalkanoate synthase
MVSENKSPAGERKRGPRPLAVHVGLALQECAKAAGATAPQMAKMLEGIRKYQDHPFARQPHAPEPVYEDGELTLSCYKAGKNAPRLLLIPSLINKSYILDLLPEKSFAQWLAGQGIEAWLLDWGRPVDDSEMATLPGLLHERLLPAIRHFTKQKGGRKFVLGYCMGGTLLGAALSEIEDEVDGVVFLASPWDFHAGDRGLADRITIGAPGAMQQIMSSGRLPMEWIQSVFAAVNTQRAMDKFMKFADMDNSSSEAELFVAVEDWLNDGLDLPGDVARGCIVEWYGQNRPPEIRKTNLPVLIVASEGDRLVPAASSLALKRYMEHAEVLEPGCGHIGMMTGKMAEKRLWEPLAAWIKNS